MDDPFLHERLLVVRGQLGDEAALAELVARYGPKLRYFIRKLTVGVADDGVGDDILQETWFSVLRGLHRLTTPAAFRVWLYRIARDQAMVWLRRQKRQPQPLATEQAAELVDANDDSSEAFTADDVAAVHRALDDLPPEQREVLVLRFLEEMTYDDIASVTATPLGTVRSRLFYGKQALKAKLQGDER